MTSLNELASMKHWELSCEKEDDLETTLGDAGEGEKFSEPELETQVETPDTEGAQDISNGRTTSSNNHTDGLGNDHYDRNDGRARHPRLRRALSLPARDRVCWRVPVDPEVEKIEDRELMALIGNATVTAREEAHAALDTVEGFADLNRKLIHALRRAIGTRDELLRIISKERMLRQQIKQEMDRLQEEKSTTTSTASRRARDEFQGICRGGEDVAQRARDVRGRTDEDYSLELDHLELEHDLLKGDVVPDLEGKLVDARRNQSTRVKEEGERALMCAEEEVRTVRAAHSPRSRDAGGGRRTNGASVIIEASDLRGNRKAGSRGERVGVEASSASHKYRTTPSAGDRSKALPVEEHRRPYIKDGSLFSHVLHSLSLAKNVDEMLETAHPDKEDSSVGGCGTASDMSDGDGCCAILRRAAMESVEAFIGDFVPKAKSDEPQAGALRRGMVDPVNRGTGHEVAEGCRLPEPDRTEKLPAKVIAMCAQEASRPAEIEAQNRVHVAINKAAWALSASFLHLVTRCTTHAPSRDNESTCLQASEATVPARWVRRLVHKSGLLRVGGGGPMLAHVDVELQQSSVKRGRVGHREFFKLVLFLAEKRFAGEPRDEALKKLTNALQALLGESSMLPGVSNRQVVGGSSVSHHERQRLCADVAAPGLEQLGITTKIQELPRQKIVPPPGEVKIPRASCKSSSAGDLPEAEWALERDRSALEAIFSHYSDSCPASTDVGGNGRRFLSLLSLVAFCNDFELIPSLMSREDVRQWYTKVMYPNEVTISQKEVAGKRQDGRDSNERPNIGVATDTPSTGAPGLNLGQWMSWLGLVAVDCRWLNTRRDLCGAPGARVLALFQWMEGSAGKNRMYSNRVAQIVPAFNFDPLSSRDVGEGPELNLTPDLQDVQG